MKTLNREQLWVSFIIVLLSLTLLYVQIQRFEGEDYSSDEATSILASQGILKQGVPQLPSGKIYWRSPVFHYANAVSMFLLGESVLGYTGISLLAYFLLILIPAYVFVKNRLLLPGILWAVFIGLNIEIQALSVSSRMYMLYTFLVFMIFLMLFYSPITHWRMPGVLYVMLSTLAALTHQHFILFCPAMFILGIYLYKQQKEKESLFYFVGAPLLLAPLLGALLSIGMHFGENLLPDAFTNVASMPVHLGQAANLFYPLKVIQKSTALPFWLVFFVGIWRYGFSVSAKGVLLLVSFLITYVALSLTLPLQLSYYVAPTIPLVMMASLSPWLEQVQQKQFGLVSWGKAGIVLLFLVTQLFPFIPIRSFRENLVRSVQEMMWWKYPSYTKQFGQLKQWVKKYDARVISSEPEVAYLYTKRIDHEVRSYGIPVKNACDETRDDQFGNTYIHSTCQLEKFLKDKSPAVFFGIRLDSDMFDVGLSQEIRHQFQYVGFLRRYWVLCYPPAEKACENLREVLAN